jgi:hypothetical protein
MASEGYPLEISTSTTAEGFPTVVDRESVALLQHLHPCVYVWSVWDQSTECFLNGYVLVTPQGLLVIDPPLFDEYMPLAFEAVGSPLLAVIQLSIFATEASKAIATELSVPHWQAGRDTVVALSALLPDCVSALPIGVVDVGLYYSAEGLVFMGDTLLQAPTHHTFALTQQATEIEPLKQALTTVLQANLVALYFSAGEPILTNATPVLTQFLSLL